MQTSKLELKQGNIFEFPIFLRSKIVGPLLALDQVLGKPWSVLAHFWNSKHW
jgi:hypothetical protein